jgi:hypothetical protein
MERVAILYLGRIAERAPTPEVFARPAAATRVRSPVRVLPPSSNAPVMDGVEPLP